MKAAETRTLDLFEAQVCAMFLGEITCFPPRVSFTVPSSAFSALFSVASSSKNCRWRIMQQNYTVSQKWQNTSVMTYFFLDDELLSVLTLFFPFLSFFPFFTVFSVEDKNETLEFINSLTNWHVLLHPLYHSRDRQCVYTVQARSNMNLLKIYSSCLNGDLQLKNHLACSLCGH